MYLLTSGSVLVVVALVSAGGTSSTMVFTVLFSVDMIEKLWLRSGQGTVKQVSDKFVKQCNQFRSFSKEGGTVKRYVRPRSWSKTLGKTLLR